MKKKVLIITYYWPPSGGSGVQRWVKFAKYLPGEGWEPVIYTPENPEIPAVDQELGDDLPDGLTVLKTPIREPYGLYKRLTGNKQVGVRFISEKSRRFSAQSFFKWIRGNLFIPDARKFWVNPSVRYLSEYLSTQKVDALITTGPPHSMHLIGLELSKRFKIPWLADFRDPWTSIDYLQEMNPGRRALALHSKLEKRVVTQADRVVVVSPSMQTEMESIGNRSADILTNGYDIDDFQPVSDPLDSAFTIVHTGMMSRSQHADSLWNVLAELTTSEPGFKEALKIKLVGAVDKSILEAIDRYGLTHSLIKMDYVPHSKVTRIQQKAWVLLLVLNDTSHVNCLLPGKLFEYLAARRPLLCLGPEEADVSDILKISDSYCLTPRDKEKRLQQFILQQFDTYKKGDMHPLNVDISPYSRKSITHQLTSILNDMTDE